ncbi:RNA-directed DNA polymerase, eukaryota, reverse transcriptase zinc-binding domain protein [Tanacetum coccineum]
MKRGIPVTSVGVQSKASGMLRNRRVVEIERKRYSGPFHGPVSLSFEFVPLTSSSGDCKSAMFFAFFQLREIGTRVPQMAPNVEVTLRGLLDLDKRDLNVDEYLDQLGFSGAYSFRKCKVWSGVDVVSRLGEISSPLYTIWSSLQDIIVGLSLGTIDGYVSLLGQWSSARTVPFFSGVLPVAPDLTCPLTYQLLRSSPGCSGPNMSFDMPASPEYLSSLARASLVEVFKLQLFFGGSEGGYTSSMKCACCKVFGHIKEECPKNTGLGVAKNLKKPSQAFRGVLIGSKNDVETTKKVSNSNPFDVLNSVENDVDLGTNGGTSNLVSKEPNSSESSEDEVASADNDMARSMASEMVGFGTNSLLEQLRDTYKNAD